jgi:hypothetical protein
MNMSLLLAEVYLNIILIVLQAMQSFHQACRLVHFRLRIYTGKASKAQHPFLGYSLPVALLRRHWIKQVNRFASTAPCN